ncbi:hypothetical protein BV25DRAFT_1779331, partial [Artomyces pyxidatus]
NAAFQEYEHWIFNLLNRVDSIPIYGNPSGKAAKLNLTHAIESEWVRLEGMKRQKWEQQYEEKRTMATRRFIYHDFKRWVGELYCRHGLEALLDRSPTLSGGVDRVDDIWDTDEFQQFRGPDGKPFLLGGDEGRLIFSLCMDGFNPYRNKQSGKKVTVGAMYMVCLNLPSALRYRVENMFLVGIIP